MIRVRLSALLILPLVIAAPVLAAEQQAQKESVKDIQKDEERGVRDYMRGRYEQAYPLLWNAARHGFKNAQYTLGVMYLKGQGVDQDFIVGTAWLGVSTEVPVEQWTSAFRSVVSAMGQEQRTLLRDKLVKYIEYYGVKTQGMNCIPKGATADCQKAPGSYPLYDFQ